MVRPRIACLPCVSRLKIDDTSACAGASAAGIMNLPLTNSGTGRQRPTGRPVSLAAAASRQQSPTAATSEGITLPVYAQQAT